MVHKGFVIFPVFFGQESDAANAAAELFIIAVTVIVVTAGTDVMTLGLHVLMARMLAPEYSVAFAAVMVNRDLVVFTAPLSGGSAAC